MFDKMLEEYKDFAELQKFAEAQFKTITVLSKKNSELEKEINHLKSLIGATAPILDLSGAMSINDEEMIARDQLRLLKQRSDQGQLTLEETKKVETFAKIINTIENRTKKDVLPMQNLSNDDLIKQLDSGTNVSK